MSDAEDDRDTKVVEGDLVYQLRKIGPDASCSKVPPIMRLRMGLTRIGRGQHNDYFLDSNVLKNFISRSHVEIHGKKNENGKTEFVLTDKGLNGTFINDCRSQKTCVLELGDKITFGHTNGYKIEPGSFAEQPKSEFQYIFETIPSSSKTAEVCEEGLSPETVESHPSDAKKETDRLFLSDIQSNKQTQDKAVKTKPTQKSRGRKDSGSQSDNELSDAKISSPSKGSKKSGKGNSEQKKSPVKETSSASRKSSTASSTVLSDTLPAVEEEKSVMDDDEDDEEEEEEEEEEEVEKKRRAPVRRKTASTHPKSSSRGKKAAPTPAPPSDSEESSSDNDESHKPEADQKPQSQIKNRPKPARKRAPQADNAPAVGSRKRRRRSGKSAASSSHSAQDDPSLEPGVEWYEDDTCSSTDCKRPKKKKTSWVQCDDCDNWYHTVCVGANYNLLKDSDAHFNCGCD